jgi:hypothetical protein
MPVLQSGRNPDNVAGPDLFDWPALALHPAQAGGDEQRLTEWVGVPRGTGAGLECDVAAGYPRRIARLEQGVNADRTGEIFRQSLAGRLRLISIVPLFLPGDTVCAAAPAVAATSPPPVAAITCLRVIMSVSFGACLLYLKLKACDRRD